MAKLTQDHKELEERLREERSQKEQFKNTKNEIEDERRLLDRTVEKLQREVSRLHWIPSLLPRSRLGDNVGRLEVRYKDGIIRLCFRQ